MQTVNIKIAVIKPVPVHELALQAGSACFETTPQEIIAISRNREHARRKALVFLLMKEECRMTSNDIAKVCNTSRQNVDHGIYRAENTVGLYLHSVCDYRNLKAVFSSLLQKQTEWLKQHSPSTSISL